MKKIFWIALILCLTVSGQSMAQNHGPDYDEDTDVDGSDLGEYAKRIQLGTATLTIGLFAWNFGKNFYLAINDFTQYYSGLRLIRDGNNIFEEINATTLSTDSDVITNDERTIHYDDYGEIEYITHACTFAREVINQITNETQIVPINVNTFQFHPVVIDWEELYSGTQTFIAKEVVLASGRIVKRSDFNGFGDSTVRLDGTPFDFEQWYGEDVDLLSYSFCDEEWPPCDPPIPTCNSLLCWDDNWAISSYNDPIAEIRIIQYPHPAGGDWSPNFVFSSLSVAYGDSIDPYFPGRDNWWDDAKTVFVTRATFTGDGFGGLDGADAICNAEAQAAGLDGTFGALLSGVIGTPYGTLPGGGVLFYPPGSDLPLDVRYVLPDGTRIMKSLNEGARTELLSPINLDAFGQPVNAIVWTGTYFGGEKACPGGLPSCFTCGGYLGNHSSDWTRSDIWGGMRGSTAASDGRWLEDQIIHCGQEAGLYCFEK